MRETVPFVLGGTLYQNIAEGCEIHLYARPHEGTGFPRWATLSGYRKCLRRRQSHRNQSHRRTLRAFIERVHPAIVKASLDELNKPEPKNHFTVGINDDVSHTSLDVDTSFMIEPEETIRCVFFGLGADETVGANKNSIQIIGEETDNFAQGCFYFFIAADRLSVRY